MRNDENKNTTTSFSPQIWIFLLIILVGWSRYLPLANPELYNFTPTLALFLISGRFLKGHLAWIGPIISIIISDLILNPTYGVNLLEPFMIVTLFSYFAIYFLGKNVLRANSFISLSIGAISSALIFHFFTCGFSWIVNPAYAKSFFGFWQAQILGEPGYSPAYLFLRNSIISTMGFTSVFYLLRKRLVTKVSHISTEDTKLSKI